MRRDARAGRRRRQRTNEAPLRLPAWLRFTPEQLAEIGRRLEAVAAELKALRRATRA